MTRGIAGKPLRGCRVRRFGRFPRKPKTVSVGAQTATPAVAESFPRKPKTVSVGGMAWWLETELNRRHKDFQFCYKVVHSCPDRSGHNIGFSLYLQGFS